MSKTSIEFAYPVYGLKCDAEGFVIVLQWVNPGDEIDPQRLGHPSGYYASSARAAQFALDTLRNRAGDLPVWARKQEV